MNYQIAISLFSYAAHPRGIGSWPIIAAVSVAAISCPADATFAVTKTWRTATGSWHLARNWNRGIPVAGDRADIANCGIARILATIPGAQTPDEIYVGATGVGTLEHQSVAMTRVLIAALH